MSYKNGTEHQVVPSKVNPSLVLTFLKVLGDLGNSLSELQLTLLCNPDNNNYLTG